MTRKLELERSEVPGNQWFGQIAGNGPSPTSRTGPSAGTWPLRTRRVRVNTYPDVDAQRVPSVSKGYQAWLGLLDLGRHPVPSLVTCGPQLAALPCASTCCMATSSGSGSELRRASGPRPARRTRDPRGGSPDRPAAPLRKADTLDDVSFQGAEQP